MENIIENKISDGENTQNLTADAAVEPPKKEYKTRKSHDKIMLAVFYIFSAIFTIACIYPFLQVLMSSFADENTLLAEGYKLIPSKFSLDAYKVILKSKAIWTSYGVTIFITVVGTIIQLIITAMAAYALSGGRLKYRNVINFFFYFTMLFGGGVVASYILIKNYLHLDNTVWVYIIPTAFNAYNCFLLRNFFNEIPSALIESGKLDGANEFVMFAKIVLPLSLPALATIGLFAAVAYWNEWSTGLLYIQKESLYTLQYRIVRLIQSIDEANKLAQDGFAGQVPPANTLRLATAIITIGPIILLYPFLQKYFVAGLKVGGVKG